MIMDTKIIAAFSSDDGIKEYQRDGIEASGATVRYCAGGYTMDSGEYVQDSCIEVSGDDWDLIADLFKCEESVLMIAPRGECYLWYTKRQYPADLEAIGKWTQVTRDEALDKVGYTFYPNTKKYFTAL